MTLLIGIKSCNYDRERGCHKIIRETWGRAARTLGINVQFFLSLEGMPAIPCEDEIYLDCPDNHEGLSHKTKAICKWTVEYSNTDFLFLCDNDTHLVPYRLVACGYERYDYAGKIDVLGAPGQPRSYKDCRGILIPECYPFASGGYGYFLSRRAMEKVAMSTVDHWAEDLWVAQMLGPAIKAGRMTGYNIPNFRNNMSWHFLKKPGAGYEPFNGWQKKLYEETK